MMLPTLISVSLAPVSYFFWASAPSDTQTSATAASAAVRSPVKSMVSPCLLLSASSGLFPEPGHQLLTDDGNLSSPMRNQEDDKEEQYAEHGAGKTLGDAFRDVRHEDDEGRSDKRAGQPADTADDHAEKQGDRERDGITVGRHELHGDSPEAARNPGDPGADTEGERLVQRDVDPHGGGSDLVVADRHHGTAGAGTEQVDRPQIDRDRDYEGEVVEPHVLGHLEVDRAQRAYHEFRRIRLGDDETLHAAGPVLEIAEFQELRHRGRKCKRCER